MFRFTIRDLLLLTVIVGLALGWGLRERYSVRQREQRWRRRVDESSDRSLKKSRGGKWMEGHSFEGAQFEGRTLRAEKGPNGWHVDEDDALVVTVCGKPLRLLHARPFRIPPDDQKPVGTEFRFAQPAVRIARKKRE